MSALFKIKNPRKKYNSIYDYAEAFRTHLLRYVIILLAFLVLVFINKEILFDEIIFAPKNAGFPTNTFMCYLAGYFQLPDLCINTSSFQLINYELSGQFSLHLMASLVAAILLTFPFLVWEFIRFIRKIAGKEFASKLKGTVLISFVLMLSGVLFAYYVIVPLTINFLINYELSEQLSNLISMRSYISNITTLVLVTGLVFQLPLVAYLLGKTGLLTRKFLKKYRKHAIIVFVIFAGIITPPDVFSQILVALPMYLLYELSIRVIKTDE